MMDEYFVDLERLRRRAQETWGEDLIRVIGVLDLDGKPARRARRWPGLRRRSKVLQQSLIAAEMFNQLIASLSNSPDYPSLQAKGHQLFHQVLARLRFDVIPHDRWLATSPPSPAPEVRAEQEMLFRQILDALLERAYAVQRGDGQLAQMGPNLLYRSSLRDLQDGASALGIEAVRAAVQPLDSWRVAAAGAHLINPVLAPATLVLPFWFPVPELPQRESERAAVTVTGATDPIYAAAREAERLREETDQLPRVGRKRGPKPGSKHRESLEERQLLDYLAARNEKGVSSQMLAEDAEAQRLYRRFKGDSGARLNSRVAEAWLRKQSQK